MPAAVDKSRRRETLNIRIRSEERGLIDRAAEMRGQSRTDFILEVARQAAEETLLGRVFITVSPEAYVEFLARLDAPPQPNERLAPHHATAAALGIKARMLSAPELLTAHHSLQGFDSGAPFLDDWLIQRALANQASGASRTYVIRDDRTVLGYYALASGAIAVKATPDASGATCPIPSRLS